MKANTQKIWKVFAVAFGITIVLAICAGIYLIHWSAPFREIAREVDLSVVDVPADYSGISEAIKRQILAVRDPKFYKHNGFDFSATAKALTSGTYTPGAQTITYDVARDILSEVPQYSSNRYLPLHVGYHLAPLIEATFTKEEILRLYLERYEQSLPYILGDNPSAQSGSNAD